MIFCIRPMKIYVYIWRDYELFLETTIIIKLIGKTPFDAMEQIIWIKVDLCKALLPIWHVLFLNLKRRFRLYEINKSWIKEFHKWNHSFFVAQLDEEKRGWALVSPQHFDHCVDEYRFDRSTDHAKLLSIYQIYYNYTGKNLTKPRNVFHHFKFYLWLCHENIGYSFWEWVPDLHRTAG